VNIEVDSDARAAVKHLKELKHADPNAQHVAVIADPVTGLTRDGLVWIP
jgi:hypothetical protein